MNERKTIFMKVTVVVRENDGDIIETEYNVNYSNHDTKLWLTKLMVWAMLNNKSVELDPIEDASKVRLFVPQAPETVN